MRPVRLKADQASRLKADLPIAPDSPQPVKRSQRGPHGRERSNESSAYVHVLLLRQADAPLASAIWKCL